MKWNKILLALLLITTVVLIGIGTVDAFMYKQTTEIENVFEQAQVSCLVEETFTNNSKTKIAVKNTSTVDAYLRLRIVTYWVDKNGDILFKEPKTLSVSINGTDWVASSEEHVYYYKHVVKPGESTSTLLTADIPLTVNERGERQVVEIFAEAIQSKPTEAVVSAWSVSVDGNGKITSAN